MDADTAPIFLTNAQLKAGANVLIWFSSFFTAFLLIYFGFAIVEPSVFKFTSQNEEEMARKRKRDRIAAEVAVNNFHKLAYMILVPGYKRLLSHKARLFAWLFLITWVISIIILQQGLDSIITQPRDNDKIEAGLVLYFISIVGYFVCRYLEFSRSTTFFDLENLEVRKKVEIHRQIVQRQKKAIEIDDSVSFQTGVIADTTTKRVFDEQYSYKRRIKYLTPIYTKIDLSPFNLIQVAVLLTEFMQVVSFPISDLFRSYTFLQSLQTPQGKPILDFLNFLRSTLSLFSTGSFLVNVNYLKFVFCWWLAVIALFVAACFSLSNYMLKIDKFSRYLSRQTRKRLDGFLNGSWILSALPLINLLYLVILNAFLEPIACLSSNDTPIWPAAYEDYVIAQGTRIQECLPIHDLRPSLHTWYSLAGFTVAFFLLTICRTAQEPQPEEGLITYTSTSELFTKCSTVLLLLLHALAASQGATLVRRLIDSFFVALILLYIIIFGSTYSKWINLARTLSFVIILWCNLFVTYYTLEVNRELLYNSGANLWINLFIGAVASCAFYGVLHFLWIKRWQISDRSEVETSTDNPSSSETKQQQTEQTSDDASSILAVSEDLGNGLFDIETRLAPPEDDIRASINSVTSRNDPKGVAGPVDIQYFTQKSADMANEALESLNQNPRSKLKGPRPYPN